ncbi:uncharacterized protein LOC121800216 [Salvia splendens]|uniref:uncharacterized protein LOC121800216 n=1 Tax=Salvia splendens TaxID=180675 RepID=UPI001C258528|nr:uncharacterized protein LOC121800216 [Salvia splendens]
MLNLSLNLFTSNFTSFHCVICSLWKFKIKSKAKMNECADDYSHEFDYQSDFTQFCLIPFLERSQKQHLPSESKWSRETGDKTVGLGEKAQEIVGKKIPIFLVEEWH